ncbi:MAG TPA: bifunctional phosphopantothenoylcysteine decarboxylase/phosphopantothenate--cysteine ligase CoaBC [Actinomycetota bacterium]|nr:bifunctional phosphopantothenoylcysteine decarboxylase/phosphopantothenate--cysteine ligase CoaBC [Actinomycetota bacterium]
MAYQNLAGSRIALGVCGGIAAYKVAGLARELTQAGADVRVVMTPSAMNFIGPITFSTLTGNPVRSELFPPTAPTEIPHTDLGRTSDLVIIAPATAKSMAKSAQGVSDDLISALLLSAACPIVMAPAMHTEMWQNEATQQNVATLVARGIRMVGPAVGALAGPDVGVGRMAEIADILQAADEELARRVSLSGCSVVITAAGTREPIDAMRFIGNASSGLMGYELAFEAVRRNAEVTLITGPTHLTPPDAATVIRVTTAEEMREAVLKAVPAASALVMAAAVSDWRPAAASKAKLKKSGGPPELRLEPTPDILAEVGESRRTGGMPELKVLVGYCAETENLQEAAAGKLKGKSLDLAVANLVGADDSGAGLPTLRAIILDREGHIDDLGLVTKRELARRVLDSVARRLLVTD